MTLQKNITVIDYGMGNIWSVLSALRFLGCEPKVSSDPIEISNAECLVLPGVGSFELAMATLRDKDIDLGILDAVSGRGINILGICLGMQLLGIESSEAGHTQGLGLMPGVISKFEFSNDRKFKIPHIGFNVVHSPKGSRLFESLPESSDFYFVHAYRMLANGLDGRIATCCHGDEFVAAYEKNNIFATQFHPEKSQTNGLSVLLNFLK
jgi:imidazole glycerol-phosphate synthase subunit HisH